MTIGTAIDKAINTAIVATGHIANWLINRISPFDEDSAKRFLSMAAADALAEMEAEEDVWEPALPDSLWAAMERAKAAETFEAVKTKFDAAFREQMARYDGFGEVPKPHKDSHAAAGSPRETPGDGEATPPRPVAGHPKHCRHCQQ